MNNLISLLLLFVISLSISAQSTFTIEEAKAYAFKYHPTVINADYDIEKAAYRIKEITSTGLPQVTGSINLSHYLVSPITLLPEEFAMPGESLEVTFVQPHNLTAGLALNQLIFDGSFFTGLRAARVYRDLTQKQKLQTAIGTQSTVEKAYLNALILKENIKLLNRNLPVLERILFETEQLYINGFAEEIEADRLKYSIQDIRTQIDLLKNQEENAVEYLKFTMGYPMDEGIILSDIIEDFLDFDASLLNKEENAKDRIEYEVLKQQGLLNDMQIETFKKQYLPQVYGFLNYEYAAQRDQFNYFSFNETWFNTFLIGLTVSVPIFDSFNKKHKIAQSKLDSKQIEVAEQLYDQNFNLAIKTSKSKYKNALKQKDNIKMNLDLAEKIYNVTIIKYKEGIGSSIEVNDAEGKLLESQNKYLNALFELVTAYADLKEAYGIY